jgi:hypothetical protein
MTNLIAYNTMGLDALLITEKAETWRNKGWLSNETWIKIKANYPINFYSPNVFMRIGGFIFSLILIMAFLGILALFTGGNIDTSLPVLAVFMGFISFAVLEFIIKSNHYKSGIDDALLYGGVCLIMGGLTALLHLNTNELPFYCLFLPFLFIAAMRYVDNLMSIVVYIFALIIVILATFKLTSIANLILPFVVMLFALIIYLTTIKLQQNKAFIYWQTNLNTLEALFLITFYAGGNYFILQQANEVYFNNPIVAMPYVFWCFTFIIPVLYIYKGLKDKNRLILSIGLLAIAAAVATFRYYFHVMPMEIAAIIGGIVLLSLAYFSIKYLRDNKTPFTYDEADSEKPFYQHAESLIIAQTFGNSQAQEGEKPLFGGGDFGGGGAGSEF